MKNNNELIAVNSRFLTQRLSGVQRFATEIALRLKAHYKGQVIFLSPSNIIDKETARKLDVIIVGKNRGYLWEQLDLPLFLYKNGTPLLINMCNVAPLFYRKSITTIHDVAYKVYAKAYGLEMRLVYGLMIPIILNRCLHAITVSEFSKKEICRCYSIKEDKLTVVYNAVDSRFCVISDKQMSSEKYIVTVSSVGDNKNFNMTLKVFDLLSKKIDGLKLYAVGITLKDAKYTKYKKYADNPNVIFLGAVSEESLIKLYSNALVFLYPSIYEGFGIPPLEAQACNCPVVASLSGPLPETLGDSALYADPYDCEGLAGKVMQVYNSSKIRLLLTKKGSENIRRFSWDKSVEKMVKIIEEYR